jgi:acyl-CoA thioesterase
VPELTPDDLATACVEKMWETDRASQGLGMTVLAVRPGYAQVTMTVREDMVNGFGLCHGAMVAAVADSAFAFAANTYDDVTVAAGFDITLVRAAYAGDILTATAVERHRHSRAGVYDVTITRGPADGDGQAEVIAEFRGRSRSLGRPILQP